MAVDIWNLAIRSAMIWDYLFIRNSSKKWPTYSGYSLNVLTYDYIDFYKLAILQDKKTCETDAGQNQCTHMWLY